MLPALNLNAPGLLLAQHAAWPVPATSADAALTRRRLEDLQVAATALSLGCLVPGRTCRSQRTKRSEPRASWRTPRSMYGCSPNSIPRHPSAAA
jgi:hypothetical protein